MQGCRVHPRTESHQAASGKDPSIRAYGAGPLGLCLGVTYRPDIDGLRAVVVSAVFAFHAEIVLFPGGFGGVDVFCVISGFLIVGILLREMAAGTFSLARV